MMPLSSLIPAPASLTVTGSLLHALARQIDLLHRADPALARLVRGAGADLARSVAAVHLAPSAGQASRHRRRARAHAEALLAHLQLASERRHHDALERREAMALASRLVALLDAGH